MKKSKREKKERRKERQLKENVESFYVQDALPVVSFDEAIQAAILEDGTVVDVIGIKPKDLAGASEAEKELDNMCFDKLFKTYSGDIKFLYLTFPTETEVQHNSLEKILKRTKSPKYRELLENRIAELKAISIERKDREFFLLFYSKNQEEHKKNYIQINLCLSSSMTPLSFHLKEEKKKQLLHKLFNKISYIGDIEDEKSN